MTQKRPIAILGAGNAASALAILLARHGRPIHLYCIEDEVRVEINQKHQNTKYLSGIKLPSQIKAFANVGDAVAKADVVFAAVPSFALHETFALAAPFLAKNVVIGSITKGLDEKSLKPITLAAASALPAPMRKLVCVIGGPAIANELAHHHPAALIIAGTDAKAAKKLANLLQNENLKVATSTDALGVGMCMALKNIYAIALGMCDGLKYPMNTKAMVMSLALSEMELLLEAVGANPRTAVGLAGAGDLLVTGFSAHGRNRTYGERLVGSDFKDPASLNLGTVEGIAATAFGMKLAKSHTIRVPLMIAIAKCLSATHHFEYPFVDYLKQVRLS